MLLYNSAISGNCYKVRLLFAKLGIEYERREVDVFDRSGRRELLGDYNPALRVPTLVFDDGRALGESGAILFHFGEGTDYVPADAFERAQVLQWMFFEQYSHEPNIAVVRFWELAGIHVPLAEREAKLVGGRAALKALDEHLSGREFLVGERYSIADIALFAYTHVAPEGGFELEPYPAVQAWLARIAAQPGHISITD
ncbi:MAG TPA: glutathione S-transferase family protein [Solirubrobacteraceae bacterium]|jgi:glutathione S-transferase|nr:glutathione S-transferase family protein [Solirubrobacteraceae bacterium]